MWVVSSVYLQSLGLGMSQSSCFGTDPDLSPVILDTCRFLPPNNSCLTLNATEATWHKY